MDIDMQKNTDNISLQAIDDINMSTEQDYYRIYDKLKDNEKYIMKDGVSNWNIVEEYFTCFNHLRLLNCFLKIAKDVDINYNIVHKIHKQLCDEIIALAIDRENFWSDKKEREKYRKKETELIKCKIAYLIKFVDKKDEFNKLNQTLCVIDGIGKFQGENKISFLKANENNYLAQYFLNKIKEKRDSMRKTDYTCISHSTTASVKIPSFKANSYRATTSIKSFLTLQKIKLTSKEDSLNNFENELNQNMNQGQTQSQTRQVPR